MPHNNNLAEAVRSETESPRRIALKQMAGLLGLSLSASALDALAATSTKQLSQTTKVLNAEQLQMTGEIAELIIPATDTPGALAVNTHVFIDQYLAECVSEYERNEFIQGLKRINQIAEDNFHKTFLACTHKQHIQLLTAIETNGLGFDVNDNHFFKSFKSLTLLGYYTSEPGATKELAYLAVPGGYKGNFPFAKIGKAWSLN